MTKTSAVSPTRRSRSRAIAVSAPCTCTCTRSPGSLGATWIQLAGELDHSGVPNIAEKLKEAQASSYMVVIDLRELEFIDYAWLGTLIAADARARQAKKSLVVVRGNGQVDRMLEQSGLLEQLEVIDLQPRTASPPEHDDDHPTRAHSATQAAPSEPTGKRAPASLLVSTSPLHHRDKAATPTRSTGFGQPME